MVGFLSNLRPITQLYSKIALGVVLILEVIDIAFRDWRDILYSDHGVVEGLVVAIAITSIIIAGKILLQQPFKRWLPYLPIFGFNIFLLLEEISFGQALLGFSSFKLGGVYFNAFHDIFSMLYKQLGTYILILMLLGIFVVVKNYRQRIAPTLEKHPPYRFVFISAVLLGLSVLFDLNMIYHPPSEEYLEMLGILAVLFAHLDITQQLKRSAAAPAQVATRELEAVE